MSECFATVGPLCFPDSTLFYLWLTAMIIASAIWVHKAKHALSRVPNLKRKLYVLLLVVTSPFVIGAWCLANPRKVFEQAKKDWNIK